MQKRNTATIPGKIRKAAPSALVWAWQALVLLDGASGPASAQEALEGRLAALPEAERRDKNLTAEYFYGALRQEIRLTWILGRVLPEPKKLPLPLRRLLLVAVYGILLLERVPAYAVLSTAVDAARCAYGPGLAKLTNGVLRSVQRLEASVQETDFYRQAGETADCPAVRARFLSLPKEIYAIWEQAYGRETAEKLALRSLARPVPAFRIHAGRPQAAELRQKLMHAGETAPLAVGDWGIAFPGGLPSLEHGKGLTSLMDDGRLSSQSAGSQWLMAALWKEAAFGEIPLWDACCGYGGKSALVAEQGGLPAFCTDASWQRLHGLPQHFHRLHLSVPSLALADGRHPPVRQWPGNILADVPCSGLGVLARRPDIRRHVKRIQEFPQLQYDLALALSQRLLPGRCLIYMTCTLRPEENEKVVQRLEAAGLRCLAQQQTPHDHLFMEGMFGAVLQKQAG